uniref:Uncharacterized protein n=1 Tax=Zea mays TaxID=4577 RepID=C0PNE7_MAIZE|nr:unknown [Zea mays]
MLTGRFLLVRHNLWQSYPHHVTRKYPKQSITLKPHSYTAYHHVQDIVYNQTIKPGTQQLQLHQPSFRQGLHSFTPGT